jgi:transcriptional regulator with XRE-family HTH domain
MGNSRTATEAKRPALYMRLAEARLAGRRQWQVAAEAEVDPAVLSEILNRHRDPTAEQAARIATVLGVGVTDVFPELAEGVAA